MANKSTIHTRNLQFLLTEIYKFLNGLSPAIMNEVFQIKDYPYDLRNPRILAPKLKSTIEQAASADTDTFSPESTHSTAEKPEAEYFLLLSYRN